MKSKLSTAAAALVFALAVPAAAQSPSLSADPRPGTAEAVRCLNRLGPKGCETMFVGQARAMARFWVFANPTRDAGRGAFVSTSYWGRATDSNWMNAKVMSTLPTKDMDIFHVNFTRAEYTFYVAAPDADGKINALAGPGIPDVPGQ
jgi:nucleoid-associated protein YgaU